MEASWRPDDPAEQGGPEQGGPSPAPAEPSYSEAWGYFYLGRTQPRHRMMSTWATCRLCGEQVGGLPSFQMWTRALWRHLNDAHLQELKKSAALSATPSPMSAESDWARLLEQMGELVMRGSRRELELEQREAALKQAELVLERKRQALRREELIMVQERHQLQMEREALSEWMKKHSPNAEVPAPPSPQPLPPREDPDTHLDDGHHQDSGVARPHE